MCNTIFENPNIFGKHTALLWGDFYTSDRKFLRDSQKLIKQLSKSKSEDEIIQNGVEYNTVKIWNEIHTETGFYEKYHYIEIEKFK